MTEMSREIKTYPISDTVTEVKEFTVNGDIYSLIHKNKFDHEQYESVELDKREVLKLYGAIQDSVLNKGE